MSIVMNRCIVLDIFWYEGNWERKKRRRNKKRATKHIENIHVKMF